MFITTTPFSDRQYKLSDPKDFDDYLHELVRCYRNESWRPWVWCDGKLLISGTSKFSAYLYRDFFKEQS